jgi:peptidoglycan/LPS O-acetylase OafA/YrhL
VNRRYDIDWLRILAVLLLIPFHTARLFNEQSAALSYQNEVANMVAL